MPLRGWMWCQIVTRALFLFMRAGSWHKNNWKLTNEWVWARSWTCRTCLNSHSASDKYVGIIEETGIWNTDAFQYSINSTLSSGEFSKSSANKQKHWYYRLMSPLSRSSCGLLQLHVEKPLFTDGSIVPCARGVQFLRACFGSPFSPITDTM